VADQLIETWADGHLLAGWVALWSVAFVALALLAPAAKRAAAGLSVYAKAWAHRLKLAENEARYLETAHSDPRIMAELQAAILRSEAVTPVAATRVVPRMGALRLSTPNT
jgi:hypothetical protein